MQGLTLDKIVVDMEGGQRFSRGQAYVAFSRVKALDGLYILNFDSSAIKKNEKVSQEMLRLHSKHLTCVPTLKCHELLTSHVTIALLNVRCVCAKLSDLMCDEDLKCANILCLYETWLNPSQNLPLLINNHRTLRSDRIFHNNKGGVLISVDQSFTPSDTVTFSNYGIEGIITKLEFPNGFAVRVVLLYRSPTTSLSQFENVLQALLSQLPGTCATIVLGDFYDSIMNCSSNIVNVMSNAGFTQLVTSPTTDRGNLIDHVYYNFLPTNVIVEVRDVYYSDHDAVFVSIPSEGIQHVPSISKQMGNNLPLQQESWSQFRFFQVDCEWQHEQCSRLGLQYHSIYDRAIGSSDTILTLPDRRSVKVMLSDHNCLFRSLTYVLTGSQEDHFLMRSLICAHMYSITNLVLPHIHPIKDIDDYIRHTKMNHDKVWDMHIEIIIYIC